MDTTETSSSTAGEVFAFTLDGSVAAALRAFAEARGITVEDALLELAERWTNEQRQLDRGAL